MRILTGIMMSLSLMLTACGEFQSINKGSNEVLSALSPYLSESDQKLANEISANYDQDIMIRENLLDQNTIEIEIEGHLAQLEIVNKGNIAFRLNGKNISFDELDNNDVLEAVISNSLISVSSKSASVLSLMGAQKSQAFLGGILSTVFGLVVKGIFNYAVEKVTEKAGSDVGNAVGTIGNSVVDNVSGTNTTTKDEVNNAKDTILDALLNALLNRLTGGSSSSNSGSQSGTVQPQPQPKCNLFCSLVGLLVNNLVK